MKTYQSFIMMATVLIGLFSACGSHSEEIQTVVDQYCILNLKAHNAPAGPAREAAVAEKKAFVKQVDDKYFKKSKVYTQMLAGMDKCDSAVAALSANGSPAAGEAGEAGGLDLSNILSLAYAEPSIAAKAYCTLIDRSIATAKNGTDAALREIVATQVMFEGKLDESFKDNVERKDSILALIKPCMEKAARFRGMKP